MDQGPGVKDAPHLPGHADVIIFTLGHKRANRARVECFGSSFTLYFWNSIKSFATVSEFGFNPLGPLKIKYVKNY